MPKSFTRWFLAWFLAAIVLLCLGLGIRVAAATEEGGRSAARYPCLQSDMVPANNRQRPGGHASACARIKARERIPQTGVSQAIASMSETKTVNVTVDAFPLRIQRSLPRLDSQ
jgi:hypothetical protein